MNTKNVEMAIVGSTTNSPIPITNKRDRSETIVTAVPRIDTVTTLTPPVTEYIICCRDILCIVSKDWESNLETKLADNIAARLLRKNRILLVKMIEIMVLLTKSMAADIPRISA